MIICLVGYIGSGKDTAAEYLIKNHNFKKMSFAQKVKDVAATVFGWNREQLEGLTPADRDWREQLDPYWGLSPRDAMQKIGTEMFRNMISPDVWVKCLLKNLEGCQENVVITDCRFQNEYDAMKRHEALFVFIDRNNFNQNTQNCCKHVSESFICKLREKCDAIISNNGTIEDMHQQLKQLLERASG